MELPEYLLETLREDNEFVLYRGERSNQSGSPSVLLLAPVSMQPALATLKKIEHEYSLRDELDSAWAVRSLAVSERRGRTMLVLEDPRGETLDRFLPGPMEMTQFLRFAVGLATALGGLHKRELIHKDVKPANVLVNPATGQVRLMGFGIASRLPRERQAPDPAEFIAGTLPYMAPEQTGRMNRSIDSRSDLYSLGVTLYEMLTGTLPFTASDPMELVHCHIARQPTPPHMKLKRVPDAVSAIVMKLLAKTVEERYQTAIGLERDLRRCLVEWEKQHCVDEFPLGEHDTPDRLLIPEKLYGRESEIGALLAAFDRVVAGGRPELVLVTGYAGIGKSSVVNELHKSLVPTRGLFASGKFDQYKRDIPYSTLAQAFQQLVQSLLGKSEAELSRWRDALREALDPNGQLIVDLVPNLELIIGKQILVPELSPQDAQRRFHFAFQRFLGIFARPEHPLTLFLDDLQWVDGATLDLLEDLLTRSQLRYLMLIGAYRDNEVDLGHPLMRKLEAIRKTGAVVSEIALAPLTRKDVTQLTADALHCEPDRVTLPVQMVYDKTAGNPFFTLQFISSLAEEGLLTFDHVAARWSWDVDRICAKRYTDNVVDLMIGKLTRLPATTREALQQLACLGNIADLTTLGLVRGMPEEQVDADLWEAVRLELIERLDGAYRFVHDRVQEAAYSLIPEQSRADAHLRIGRLLAAHTPQEKREDAIFEIVNQLNRGAPRIASQDERDWVAELNLSAGKRAKMSSAYASALTYLTAGAALLQEDAWERRQELAFALELHRADCELWTGALPSVEDRLAALAARAVDTVQRAAVASRRVDLYTMLGASDRSVAVGLECLRHAGIDWATHPAELEARREYEKIWSQLGSRAIEDLIDLPPMQDPESLATLDVLTALGPPTLYTDGNLYALTSCRAVNLSLERGNSDAAPAHYASVGLMAGDRFGDYDAGYRLAKMGCDLTERRGLRRFGGKTYSVFSLVVPWTRPVRECINPARRAFDMANEQGDPTYAAYACWNLTSSLLAAGDPLEQVEREFEHGLEVARTLRFGFVADMISAPLALTRTLRGESANFGVLDDGRFTERSFEERLTGHPALALPECFYWIRKLQARFLAGDHASAFDAAERAEKWLSTSASLSVFVLERAEYHLYAALCRAACCEPMGPDPYAEHREALAAHDRQLRAWAANCPQNFEDRTALVGAEIARIEGRDLDAMRLYEQAIRSAHANGFIHNEAIAYQVAARFYAARGFDKIADAYLRAARYGYLRWGADGKVHQLDQHYPQLRQEKSVITSTSSIAAPVEHLDLATVIKVSQAVSGEMVLEKLIDRLMRAAIEHAGAERGLWIVPRGDELQTEAEATISGEDVTVHLRDGTHTPAALPESLVRYVMRTQETVMLDDASSQNPFSADPYIVQRRARSILSLPLINQRKLIGILYLENNLTPRVFTPDRVTVLKVLASQAAISLENSRLYRDLADREGKIRRLVDANILGIFISNSEGAIIEANDAFLRIVQYSRGDVVSGRLRWTDLTPPEWCERDQRAVAEANATGTIQPYEKEYFRKDGSRVPVLVGGALFQEGENEGVAFVLDLSEQRRAEALIREQEAELREVVDTIPAIVWSALPDGSNSYANKRSVEYCGMTREQIAGSGWEAGFHPDDLERHKAKWFACVASGEPCEDEVRFRRADGQYRWYLQRGVPLRDEAGNIVKWYGVLADIEDRKRAEEALRTSEAYLAEAQRLSHTGSFGWKPDSGEIVWSDETYRIFEYDLAEKPTINMVLERVHPQDRALAQQVIEGVSRSTDFEHEYRLVMPSGAIKHIHVRAHALSDSAGTIEVVGAVTDITQRKTSEEKIRRLVDANILGIFIGNSEGAIIEANDAFLRIVQYSREDLVSGRLRWTDLTPPEWCERDQRAVAEASANGTIQPYEKEYFRKDGSRVPVLVGGALFQGGGNEGVAFSLDLSEQKRSEAAIREAERELRQILDFAPWHVAVLGADGKAMYLNKVGLDYHGLTPDAFQDYDPRRSFHPDDRDRIVTREGRAKLLSDQPFEIEARLAGKDGKYRWFLFRFNPLRDEEGRITRWFVTSTDIEDRKQTEERLQNENVALREEIDKASMFEEIVGTSPALQTVLSRISKVAPSDSTVLITGETGTGKELIARAVHRRSDRAARPFVSVNCAAIPRDLIASELFGHEKGAFTGATQQRLGRFELASGGTLFLDEVGELPAETQIALLRVLQEHEFERIGGTRQIHVDVRVIAATNRDLQAAISAGSFRSDLFYRLNVFPIEMPSLRERREDIPLLVEYFLDRYARKAGKHITTVEKKTLQVLHSYPWPGNIRELQNVIERSVIVCETEHFSVDESWLSRRPLATEPNSGLALSKKLPSQEKAIIEAALRESGGRVSGPSGAAVKLGIPGSTLDSKIRSLKINKNRFKTDRSTDRP